jgi:hypothetical protein
MFKINFNQIKSEMALSCEVTKDSVQQFAQKSYKANVVENKATIKHREATEKSTANGNSC